jgi:hypothetical protein
VDFFVQHFSIFPRFLGVGLGFQVFGFGKRRVDFRGQISKNARFFELGMFRIGQAVGGGNESRSRAKTRRREVFSLMPEKGGVEIIVLTSILCAFASWREKFRLWFGREKRRWGKGR